jgi:hypothetical protein
MQAAGCLGEEHGVNVLKGILALVLTAVCIRKVTVSEQTFLCLFLGNSNCLCHSYKNGLCSFGCGISYLMSSTIDGTVRAFSETDEAIWIAGFAL